MDQVTSQTLVRESVTYLSCKPGEYMFPSCLLFFFFPTVHSRIANLLVFYDLKERLGSCRESNSDKYTLLKLHCLISHQSNLKINLMFDREPAYSLQDTTDMLRPLSERKILTLPFCQSWSICIFFSERSQNQI